MSNSQTALLLYNHAKDVNFLILMNVMNRMMTEHMKSDVIAPVRDALYCVTSHFV